MAKSASTTKSKPKAAAKPKAASKKPAAKPATKSAKPAAKTKPAKPAAKPTVKPAGKPAKRETAVLVRKKPVAVKGDKATSVRVTRGKEPLVKPGKFIRPITKPQVLQKPVKQEPPAKVNLTATFLKQQRQRLLQLRDDLTDSMNGVASETLRSRAEGSEASAFGMHQADAGSDAYDRDFALNLLSQEQDALYEIDEALKRLDAGKYGTCEMSGRPIPVARLEARPYARFTVECQEIVDREMGPSGSRRPIRSLFGLGSDDEDEDGDEDSVEEKES